MTTRAEIEAVILGAMMMQKSCVAQVMDVLKPKNFKHDTWLVFEDGRHLSHATIYETIVGMYPEEAIDLLTVTLKMEEQLSAKYKIGVVLAELGRRVASTCHVMEHAFILLQIDIKDRLEEILKNSARACRTEMSNPKADELALADKEANLMKMLDMINKRDVFLSIDATHSCLDAYKYEIEAQRVMELKEAVNSRVREIKQKHKLDLLIGRISELSELNMKQEAALTVLTRAIKRICTTSNNGDMIDGIFEFDKQYLNG